MRFSPGAWARSRWAHEFLVFEDGPSMDFELQWATYRDAADQSALSAFGAASTPD